MLSLKNCAELSHRREILATENGISGQERSSRKGSSERRRKVLALEGRTKKHRYRRHSQYLIATVVGYDPASAGRGCDVTHSEISSFRNCGRFEIELWRSQEKPGANAGREGHSRFYLRRRRRVASKPSPLPINMRLAGSGTAGGVYGPSPTNPVSLFASNPPVNGFLMKG